MITFRPVTAHWSFDVWNVGEAYFLICTSCVASAFSCFSSKDLFLEDLSIDIEWEVFINLTFAIRLMCIINGHGNFNAVFYYLIVIQMNSDQFVFKKWSLFAQWPLTDHSMFEMLGRPVFWFVQVAWQPHFHVLEAMTCFWKTFLISIEQNAKW